MKETYLILILISLIFPGFGQAGVQLTPPITATSIPQVLENLANFFFTLALYALPVVIVVGGIFFVTAAGNPEQIAKGKKIIIYSLIGFIILLAARGLIALMRQALEVR